MTRTENQDIETKVQVLDANGDPVTSATISYKIYDAEDSVFTSGSMTHVGDGIYSTTWTPTSTGEWTAECYATNPKFYKSFTYHIETAPASTKYIYKPKPLIGVQHWNPTQNEWKTIVNLSGGIRAFCLNIYQQNSDNAAKDIEVRITVDGSTSTCPANTSGSLNSSAIRCILLDAQINQFYWKDPDLFPYQTFLGPTTYKEADKLVLSLPLECETLLIQMRTTSAPGTNQILAGQLSYAQLEEAGGVM